VQLICDWSILDATAELLLIVLVFVEQIASDCTGPDGQVGQGLINYKQGCVFKLLETV